MNANAQPAKRSGFPPEPRAPQPQAALNPAGRWRFSFLGGLVLVLPFLVILQMIRFQANPLQVEQFRNEGKISSTELRNIIPARGQIYDRWGNLLAGNQTVYEVGVELRQVKNPQVIAQTVTAALGVDYITALAQASLKPSDNAVYSIIADNVPQVDVDRLQMAIDNMDIAYNKSDYDQAFNISGLVIHPHLGRIYPEKTLGSNFLGFVSREGRGYFGVEERFNDLLAGKPRTIRVPLDPLHVGEIPHVPDGASLVLTIDREIQRAMEELIDQQVAANGATSGTIVVVNPRTGEVLALASQPRLDLNEFWRYSQVYPKDVPFNRTIMQAYEPGSVFKVLTMASALDSGAVKPETTFVDRGVIEVGGARIYNWNSGAWGPQDMEGCMRHSLNVCLAWVATQMGPEVMYRYLQAFGIGHLTGIDLADETPGRLKSPGDSDWYMADLGTNAFGQGVAASPLQMAAAISAVANDGKMMAPKIVSAVINEGYQHNIEDRVAGLPIRAETANTLSRMLARSLEGESSDALVTGYRVAGKTGTAEIPTPFGYTSNATNASFVGWGPVDDPRFLVYVWLEKPTSSPWGSVVAAPVFRMAVEKLVVLMNIPPDQIRKQLKNR
jgi:cell division protein FtsI/penicillin-binding protein 2